MVVELYPHQEKAVSELHNGSILWGGVGTGKSLVAATYYMRKEAPKDVYVITTAKKRDSLDWDREFARYGVGRNSDATVAGTLTVDSWNNIGRYREVQGAFFIFDEQRLVGSGEWSKNFLYLARRNNWILLTATPGDTWLDYIPVFVANGFYKNRTEFKREHVVYNAFTRFPKVEKYVDTGRLVRYRDYLLVEMPFERHTKRNPIEITVDYDRKLFEKVVKNRWHVYENRPLRNIAELFLVMRRVVNTDPSRLQALKSLIQTHPKLIVFYNFDFELKQLRTLTTASIKTKTSSPIYSLEKTKVNQKGLKTSLELAALNQSTSIQKNTTNGLEETTKSSMMNKLSTNANNGLSKDFTVAEWNGHKHEDIPQTDSWVYLVQYTAGAEGWNCTSTDAVVFYSLTYSYKIWEQAHGRIDRLNTGFTDLFYYTLMSNSFIDFAIAKSLGEKRSFNEAKYMRRIGMNQDIGVTKY